MNIGVLQWGGVESSGHRGLTVPEPRRPQPRVAPGGGQAPHLMVWSQIFTVQSELQDMKTLVW